MIWLTWRQHRAEAFTAFLLLAAIGVLLLVSGRSMHAAFQTDGVAACLASTRPDETCAGVVGAFQDRYVAWGDQLTWLNFLPAFIGMFLGAPLLAREFEHGTWRLAWTQSVTRTRWFLVKFPLLLGTVVALSAAATAMLTWWRQPLDELQGRLDAAAFNFEGLSLIANSLFAFALGVLAGVVLRRTVAAMAITLVAAVLASFLIAFAVRPHYQTPVTRLIDPVTHRGAEAENRSGTTRDWILRTGWIDQDGRKLSRTERTRVAREAHAANRELGFYLRDLGLRQFVDYQPANRFWRFQIIEATILTALALPLVLLALVLVRRRTG